MNNVVYYGKTPFGSNHILMNLFGYLPFSKYITTEMFNYNLFFENRKKWFCSYPYGVEAVLTGLNVIGNEKYFIYSFEKITDFNEFITIVDECLLNCEYCIVGPIEKLGNWDDMESYYFQGFAKFGLIQEKIGDKYILYDCEGCRLVLSAQVLFDILYNSDTSAVIKIKKEEIRLSAETIGNRILRIVCENRIELKNSKRNFVSEFKKIYDKSQNEGLLSSELFSLKYMLYYLKISICHFEEFISLLNSYKPSYDLLCFQKFLNEYKQNLNLLYSVERGKIEIGKVLTILLFFENQLDEFLSKFTKELL